MQTLNGIGVSGGKAAGWVFFLHRTPNLPPCGVPTDPKQEIPQFLRACCTAILQLDTLNQKTLRELDEKVASIFQIHHVLLMDPDFFACISNYKEDGASSAEYAVLQTKERFSSMLAGLHNQYMQGRAADVEDIAAHLLRLLADGETDGIRMESPIILAAAALSPSDILELSRAPVHRIVTIHGSADSHFAILATIRALILPAYALIGDDAGRQAWLDADGGTLLVKSKRPGSV